MTQKEFEDRTAVKVPFHEYQAIEKVYMESDLDKDQFCKMWCLMNKSRVKKSKAEAKIKEEESKQKNLLLDVMFEMDAKMIELRGDFTKSPLTVNFLSEKSLKLLEKVGIAVQITYKQAIEYGYPFPRHYRIDETSYEIKKYLNII